MNKINPHFITTADGKTTHAVLTIDQWNDIQDALRITEARAAIASGAEELMPDAVVARLVAGENPVKVWRDHRGLTQARLAAQAGVTQAYLSDIEAGKKSGSAKILKALAQALGVDVDDLI